MADRGYLKKAPRTRRYELGPVLIQLAQKQSGASLIATARPFLEELRDRYGVAVFLSIRVGYRWLPIDVAVSRMEDLPKSPVGADYDLNEGAPGLLHLAYMPLSARESYLKAIPGRPQTHISVTDVDRLRMEMQRAREEGVAIGPSGFDPTDAVIAAPIFGRDPEPVWVLLLFVPAQWATAEAKASFAAVVRLYAAKISQALQANL